MGYPVVFVQTRIGKGGRPFFIYKFRSMVSNSQNAKRPVLETFDHLELSELKVLRDSFKTTKVGDSRITILGKTMRKYSLDELPQLWNILIGNMSVVGPRPDLPIQRVDYPKEYWIQRHALRPGLTGFAQVNGRSMSTIKERIENEQLWLVEPSIGNYFKVISLTIMRLTKGSN